MASPAEKRTITDGITATQLSTLMTGKLSQPDFINLRTLDVLRGILATYVLCGHARWLLWEGHSHWITQPHPLWSRLIEFAAAGLRYGHQAVMIFFVLSGFFIHLWAARKLRTGAQPDLSAMNFFGRRLRRLAPPYFFAVVITVAADFIGRLAYPSLYSRTTGDSLIDENFGPGGYTGRSLVPALLMLPNSFGFRFGSNGPLWSLAYEVVYYLLYPLWLRARLRIGPVIGFGVTLSASTLIGVIWLQSFLGVVLLHYTLWLLGAGLAESYHSARFRIWLNWKFGLAGCIVGILVFAVMHELPFSMIPYAIGGVSAVVLFASVPRWIAATQIHRFWEQLGISSYTIYVCHFPLIAMLSAALMVTFRTRPASGWVACAGAILVAAICWASSFVCERPFLTHRREAHAMPGKP